MNEPEDDPLAAGAGGKAIRGGMLRTASYVGTLLLGLISIPLMTRHLGVEDFGYYVTVTSIVFLVAGFSEAGLSNLGIREYAVLDLESRKAFLQALTGLRLVLTAAGLGVTVLLTAVSGQPYVVVVGVAIAGFGLLLGLAQQTYSIPLTVGLRFGWLSVLDLVRQAALVGGIVVCVVIGTGLVPFFWANVASGGAVLVGTLVLVRSGGVALRPGIDLAVWKRVLTYALPYTLATVAGLMCFRLGVIVLGYVGSPHEVGIYSTAFRITDVLTQAPFVIGSAAFPILARSAGSDSERMRYGIQKLFEVSVVLGGFLVVLLTVGARFAIEVIAPLDKFADSIPLLRVQSCALLFTFIHASFSFALLSLERYGAFLWSNLVAVAIAAGGTALLGPSMGGMGAAIATSAAELSLAVSYVLALRAHRRDLTPSLGVLPRVALAGAAGGAVALLGLPAMAAAALSGVAYLGVCWVSGAIPQEILNAVLRRDPGSAAGA